MRGHGALEALPLVAPEVRTPIGFMAPAAVKPSRALEAALGMLQEETWGAAVAGHSGALQ